MKPFKEKIVGVLMGGLSREREVSLRSGQAVLDALLFKGYDAVAIDVGEDIIDALRNKGVEVAFLALHGRYGEDGCMQGLLELMKIPYTGSSVLASALAMDKILTKDIASSQGILTPSASCFDARHESLESFIARFDTSFPVIVKPSREGSTLGIYKVDSAQDLRQAAQEASRFDHKVLIERFVNGREVTVAVCCGQVLPVVEVQPKTGFYDYAAKYTPGATSYFCPADLPAELTQHLQEQSERLYRYLGCEGVARADFIVTPEGDPYFLEINTLPGMTSTSLVPKAAAAAGLTFSELVETVLSSARLKLA